MYTCIHVGICTYWDLKNLCTNSETPATPSIMQVVLKPASSCSNFVLFSTICLRMSSIRWSSANGWGPGLAPSVPGHHQPWVPVPFWHKKQQWPAKRSTPMKLQPGVRQAILWNCWSDASPMYNKLIDLSLRTWTRSGWLFSSCCARPPCRQKPRCKYMSNPETPAPSKHVSTHNAKKLISWPSQLINAASCRQLRRSIKS